MPYGTFTNVLRLHLTRSYTLETPWPEDGFYVDTIYYYLHPGTHYPLVEVYSNSAGEDLSSLTVTTGVRWLSDPFAGIQGTVAPANTLVAVAQGDGLVRLDVVLTTGGAATIDVIDAAGRRAAQERMALSAGASSHTLSVSTLRPGLYSVRLLLNGQQMTTRLVMP
ncbi:MAG: T9SS type A sorting domain-containing protein [Flavobacteriales bacterium]|nr:T9SS type A sorting domain-containing protein [Flavobacteriales bacterium]